MSESKTTKKHITERWFFYPSCIVLGLLGGPALIIYFHFANKFIEWVTK